MKNMIVIFSLGLLPTVLFAKNHQYRLPAQAAPKLTYTASCQISKGNLKTSPGWVTVAEKDLVIKTSDGKSNPDIVLNADDVQIEYTALVNEIDLRKGSVNVFAAGYLTLRNLKTSDSMILSGHSYTEFSGPKFFDLASVNVTYTAGYLDPKAPNSYQIGCSVSTMK